MTWVVLAKFMCHHRLLTGECVDAQILSTFRGVLGARSQHRLRLVNRFMKLLRHQMVRATFAFCVLCGPPIHPSLGDICLACLTTKLLPGSLTSNKVYQLRFQRILKLERLRRGTTIMERMTSISSSELADPPRRIPSCCVACGH